MRLINLFLIPLLMVINGCTGGSSSGSGNTSSTSTPNNPIIGTPVTPSTFTGFSYTSLDSYTSNVMPLYVNDSVHCLGGLYINYPCVSVTVCSITSPTTCATIDNILLDTGSNGLRLFSSVIPSNISSGLVPVTAGSNTLGECVQYGDGSSNWGQVEYAYVKLAGEPKVAVPIQVINSNYQIPPVECQSPNSTPDTDPSSSGFNGILGVSYLAQDCGTQCYNNENNQMYFTCNGTSCNGGAYVALSAQVTNPISVLPADGSGISDNNGLSIVLPAISSSGTNSTSGTITLGVGRHSSITGTPTYLAVVSQTSIDGFYTTEGSSYNSFTRMPGFLDTGSNLIYYTSNLPDCGGSLSGYLCPNGSANQTFTNTNPNNVTQSSVVTFQVGNALNLFNTGNSVYPNIAAGLPSGLNQTFDWGLPFFFGRTVYVGINGRSSSLGSGPFYAY